MMNYSPVDTYLDQQDRDYENYPQPEEITAMMRLQSYFNWLQAMEASRAEYDAAFGSLADWASEMAGEVVA